MRKLLCLLFFGVSVTSGQIDLKNFTTLQSSGTIPSDFSYLAREKVANDENRNENLSQKSDEVFKQNIHYSLDQIIHSGLCIYGDPISVYVDQVARKLLKDDEELYSQLRFYTLKSNVSNAFSTHQGIIMFTTGLISQFANETQLAYVLAHEIIHFREKHVVQTFEWKLQNKYNMANLTQFNNYSREKEIEADSKAIDMCLKAGYSSAEIYNSFDVLMFSHLPFDEIKFPLDYFNSPLFYIPESEFTKEVYPIKMDEEYDDEHSTHPSIDKRKEAIRPLLEESFGQGSSFMGEVSDFITIRNYARFESVRTSLLEMEFSRALYQLFLLEREFSDNYTLARWKAHAWNGLLRAKLNGFWSDVTVSRKNYEGESAVLYEYIKKLDKYGVAAHAMREITDAVTTYPDSEELKKLRVSTLKLLAASGSWSWSKYSEVAFHEAFAPRTDTLDTVLSVSDTMEIKNVQEPVSKYDRIKGSGAGKNTSAVSVNDSTKYYFYGLSDLVGDESFKKEFKEYQAEYDASTDYSYRKKKKSKEKPTIPVIGSRVIVVEPTTRYYSRKKYEYGKSDAYQNLLIDAIHSEADNNNVKLFDYSTSSLKDGGTAVFNQRAVMMSYLRQYASLNEPEYFVPVDFELVQDVQQKCATSKVLFSWTEYSTGRIAGRALIGMIIPPLAPLSIISSVGAYRKCDVTFVVMDMESGEVDYVQSNTLNSAGGKLVLRSEVHNLFNAKK